MQKTTFRRSIIKKTSIDSKKEIKCEYGQELTKIQDIFKEGRS